MNNQTIIILVVAALIIFAIIMMNKPNEQAAAPVVVQPPANLWSSLGAIGGILTALGIGSGSGTAVPPDSQIDPSVYRLINNGESTPLITTQRAANSGFEYLVNSVNTGAMDGTQFNV